MQLRGARTFVGTPRAFRGTLPLGVTLSVRGDSGAFAARYAFCISTGICAFAASYAFCISIGTFADA